MRARELPSQRVDLLLQPPFFSLSRKETRKRRSIKGAGEGKTKRSKPNRYVSAERRD